MSLEKLRAYGANVDEGLARCMNNESFYLRMVRMALDDGSFGRLEQAVQARDKKAAFEAAHAMKGVMGNLSLTPLFRPVSEMTERLRAGEDADYQSDLDQILSEREKLRSLLG